MIILDHEPDTNHILICLDAYYMLECVVVCLYTELCHALIVAGYVLLCIYIVGIGSFLHISCWIFSSA
jgi:hypothetical protein